MTQAQQRVAEALAAGRPVSEHDAAIVVVEWALDRHPWSLVQVVCILCKAGGVSGSGNTSCALILDQDWSHRGQHCQRPRGHDNGAHEPREEE